jgi:hypothetical protein
MVLAILVDEETSDGTYDDRQLLDPRLLWNFDLKFVSWRNIAANWIKQNNCKAVILRSPYSYIQNPNLFIDQLEMIQELCVLMNPVQVVKWNLHKKYLIQMRDQFNAIVPNMILSDQEIVSKRDVEGLFERIGHDKYLILKPAISGGSKDTFKLSKGNYRESVQEILNAKFGKDREYILQEYVPSIESEGELSLIFFSGKFSHAIQKIPAEKDFRVQIQFGGRNVLVKNVDPQAIEMAEKLINDLKSIFPKEVFTKILYTRIDLVLVSPKSKSYALMEIELIEPRLFFHEAGFESVQAFYNAVNANLSQH